MARERDALWIFGLIFLVILFFWPVFLQGNVAMNGNNLMSSFVPWRYEEHQGRAAAPFAKPGMLDQLRLYIPYLTFMQREFRAGSIPLWNPHNFSGTPLVAELQSAVFYPTNILLLFLSVPNYWNTLIILGYILAVIFTYLYVRSLNLGPPFAAFSAVVFAFSSFMVAWSQEVLMAIHSIAWLPLLLLATDRFLARQDRKWWAVFVFGCTMSLLSGYLQTSLYVFLFVFAYMLWRSRRGGFRLGVLLMFGMMIAVVVNALQFLPAHELYALSSRKIVDVRSMLSHYLLQVPWLITYVFPDFFGHPTTRNETLSFVGTYYERALSIGTLPVLLALFAVVTRKKSKNPRIVGWYGFLWLITLSLSLQLPLSYLLFHLDVPFFATGISNRILFLSAFCGSVLGAYGLHAVANQKSKALWITLLFIPLCLGIFIWWYSPTTELPSIRRDWLLVARRNVIVPIGLVMIALAATVLFRKRIGAAVTLLLILTLLQIYYGFAKFMPFADRRYFYPTHPVIEAIFQRTASSYERFWGYGGSTFDYSGAYIENNLATSFGIYAAEGYDSLHDHRYGQLLFAASNGRVQTNLSRSDAVLERAPDVNRTFTAQTNRLRLLELLGVRYIIDRDEEAPRASYQDPKRFDSKMFAKVWQEDLWRIFEFQRALPRAWLVGKVFIASSDQEVVDRILDTSFDLRKTVVVQEPLTGDTLAESAVGSARITQYQSRRVVIETVADATQLLVLTDTFFPGWKAHVDGLQVKIYRTNFAFRGVVVPGGTHTVVFSYEPESFERGKEFTLLGVVLFAVTYIGLPKIERKR